MKTYEVSQRGVHEGIRLAQHEGRWVLPICYIGTVEEEVPQSDEEPNVWSTIGVNSDAPPEIENERMMSAQFVTRDTDRFFMREGTDDERILVFVTANAKIETRRNNDTDEGSDEVEKKSTVPKWLTAADHTVSTEEDGVERFWKRLLIEMRPGQYVTVQKANGYWYQLFYPEAGKKPRLIPEVEFEGFLDSYGRIS